MLGLHEGVSARFRRGIRASELKEGGGILHSRHKKRWMILGGTFGAGIAAIVVSALTVFASAGVAARADKPVNVDPPTISGTAEDGKVLSADRGNWSNKPTDFNYQWRRCDKTGGSCANISGAHALKYTLTSADVGNTLRFRVEAKNADGSTTATSVPTAVVQKTAPTTTTTTTTTTTPSRGNGCPSGNGNPDQVASISAPARLLIDTVTSSPRVATASTDTLVVRLHVTSTCTGPVQGALVYATATPFNQFNVPSEQPTGSDGWAEIRFNRLRGFPVSSKQQLIALFARARKPGEALLGGISTRRLFSLPVNLRG